MRAETKIPSPGRDSDRPVTNAPVATPTGGNPVKATNAHMVEGKTFLELFSGGDCRGTSEDHSLPSPAEKIWTNAKKMMPAKPKDVDPDEAALARHRRDHSFARGLGKRAAENEPTPDKHEGSPTQLLRPRSELIAFDKDGVVGIDKGDYILFPGGGIDDGEPPLLAVIREAIEEADLKIISPETREIVESIWPQGVNDFWDDSAFDGERTYFFTGVHDGKLGTTHPDREDFDVIPFATLISRLKELVAKNDWAKRANEVRLELVEAARDMAKKDPELKGKKLASVPRQHHGWALYRNSLRRIYAPKDPKVFVKALQDLEAAHGHYFDEVRRFPDGRVLIVLRSGDSPTNGDFTMAKHTNTLAEKHAAEISGSMRTQKSQDKTPSSAPGLLVDLDGTVVAEWDDAAGIEATQKVQPGVKELLKKFKAAGVRIIGVTNRSVMGTNTLADVLDFNDETLELLPEIDDIVFCTDEDDAGRKPSPAMLEYAEEAFSLDPVICMVGNTDDDHDAAEAAGVTYFDEKEFFTGGVGEDVLATHTEMPLKKQADAAALLPKTEYVYLDPEGKVLVRRDSNRRFHFPTEGKGAPAPYSSNVRVIPEEGAPEPGYHGYDYAFHLGEGEAPADFPGEWIPHDQVLKQVYGSMGLAINKPFRNLDRARARVIHRAIRKSKAVKPETPVVQNPEEVAQPAPVSPQESQL